MNANTWQRRWLLRRLASFELYNSRCSAIPRPIRIYLDNYPALDLVNIPIYHSRSKHIYARYQFVRDRVHVEKENVLEKIRGGQMGTDMLTKNVAVGVVRFNKKLLGMM